MFSMNKLLSFFNVYGPLFLCSFNVCSFCFYVHCFMWGLQMKVNVLANSGIFTPHRECTVNFFNWILFNYSI